MILSVAALALAAIPTPIFGYGYESSDILYCSQAVDQQNSSSVYATDDDIPDFNSPNSLVSDGDEFGYFSAPSSPEFGSDAWLDRHYAAVTQHDARLLVEENGAASAVGSAPKKRQSRDIFGFPVETNAKDGDTFYERWIESDTPPDSWEAQVLPVGLMYPSYLAGRKERTTKITERSGISPSGVALRSSATARRISRAPKDGSSNSKAPRS